MLEQNTEVEGEITAGIYDLTDSVCSVVYSLRMQLCTSQTIHSMKRGIPQFRTGVRTFEN